MYGTNIPTVREEGRFNQKNQYSESVAVCGSPYPAQPYKWEQHLHHMEIVTGLRCMWLFEDIINLQILISTALICWLTFNPWQG